jgi:hypothetical protein
MNNLKFSCDFCNFNCNYESKWNKHINTIKHKNNGILIKNPKKTKISEKKCDECNFIAKHNEGLKTHKLTKHCNEEDRKNNFTYYCKLCDFGTLSKSLFDTHNDTKKHKNIYKLFNDNI